MTSVEDKENTSEVETIIIDDTPAERKENINTFFSPPKKKFKQDALPFTKLPKNEATPKKDLEDDISLKKLAESCKKQNSPVNIQTSKTTKTNKNESPKISTSPKNIPSPKNITSEKNVKVSKNSPGVNKTKDIKSDGIQFPKLSKEDALKESEKEVQNMMEKSKEQEQDEKDDNDDEDSGNDGEDPLDCSIVNGVASTESTENCETPLGKKTPSSAKKVSPVSKEERQRLKEEKEMLKAARLKEMEEKRKKKEEEKMLKQAEKEKRENERKEKERIREEEKKKREEERKQKEEEKQKKEELLRVEKEKKDAEKEKKDLEKKMKEEQKRQEEEKKKQDDEALRKKKEKEANHFRSFFTKKRGKESKAPAMVVEEHRFKPFQVKEDMVLAPLVRNNNINRELLDKVLEAEIPNVDTYLKHQATNFANNKKPKYTSRRKKRHDIEEIRKLEIKNKMECPRKTIGKPKPTFNVDIENVVVIDDNSNDIVDEDTEDEDNVCDEKYLYISKLLQFSENTRPAYYGTWRKKSVHISGRKPFTLDKGVFNYDIDSDEEWIDEPGENLSDVADEDEEEEKETEDDQDGFFVPHGYLSDDEGIKDQLDEEEEDKDKDEEVTKSTSRSDEEKMKLKVCFERRYQRIKQQKPTCIGITYVYNIDTVNPLLKDYIKVPLFKPVGDKEKEDEEDGEITSPQSGRNTPQSTAPQNIPQTVPEEAMPFLIKYVHGNGASIPTMIKKFRQFWESYGKENEIRILVSKRQLEKKIQSIASRTGMEGGKTFYIVKDVVITKYGLKTDLKYGGGLPEIKSMNNTSTTSTDQSSEIKNNSNNDKTIDNDVSFDTSMEVN